MVRSAGLDVEAQITHETWMCTADRSPHRLRHARVGCDPAEVGRMPMKVTDEIVT